MKMFIAIITLLASAATAANMTDPARWFIITDINNDGEVTEAECLQRDREVARRLGRPHNADAVRQRFQMLDVNHDGKITAREIRSLTDEPRAPSAPRAKRSLDDYHDFSGKDGKTARCRVVAYDPSKEEVILERKDKHKVTLSLSALAPADQIYVTDWCLIKTVQSGKCFDMSAREKIADETKNKLLDPHSNNESSTITFKDALYEITLRNRSPATLKDIRLEYRLFYRTERVIRARFVVEERVTCGTIHVDQLEPRSSTVARTEPLRLCEREWNADYDTPPDAGNKIEDELIGVWARARVPLRGGGGVVSRDLAVPNWLPNRKSWVDQDTRDIIDM